MPPRLRKVLMDRDDLLWEKSDDAAEAWERSSNKAQSYRDIAKLILECRPGEAVELHRPIRGGYNIFYRLEYEDGSPAALRIPIKDLSSRDRSRQPDWFGPFLIIEYVEHEGTLFAAMKDPALEEDEYHILDPNISEEKLETCYRQMASIVLQLSTLTFSRIGSLVQEEDGEFNISGRPLIQNVNHLLEFTGCTPELLPSEPYISSEDWYSALADMHMAQLTFQRNDAVDGEEDARDKYVARQLFRRLAAERRLTAESGSDKDANGEVAFRLFSEDLRPSNVLVDKDLRVVGVIDWEFAYAAPEQFSFDPPWWLLLRIPDE